MSLEGIVRKLAVTKEFFKRKYLEVKLRLALNDALSSMYANSSNHAISTRVLGLGTIAFGAVAPAIVIAEPYFKAAYAQQQQQNAVLRYNFGTREVSIAPEIMERLLAEGETLRSIEGISIPTPNNLNPPDSLVGNVLDTEHNFYLNAANSIEGRQNIENILRELIHAEPTKVRQAKFGNANLILIYDNNNQIYAIDFSNYDGTDASRVAYLGNITNAINNLFGFVPLDILSVNDDASKPNDDSLYLERANNTYTKFLWQRILSDIQNRISIRPVQENINLADFFRNSGINIQEILSYAAINTGNVIDSLYALITTNPPQLSLPTLNTREGNTIENALNPEQILRDYGLRITPQPNNIVDIVFNSEGRYNIVPRNPQFSGPVTISLDIQDPLGQTGIATQTINFEANRAPTLTLGNIPTGMPNQNYNLASLITATDPDNDNVTIRFEQISGPNIRIENNSFTPTLPGTYGIRATALDARGAATSRDFNVVVPEPNRANFLVQQYRTETPIENVLIRVMELNGQDISSQGKECTTNISGNCSIEIGQISSEIVNLTYIILKQGFHNAGYEVTARRGSNNYIAYIADTTLDMNFVRALARRTYATLPGELRDAPLGGQTAGWDNLTTRPNYQIATALTPREVWNRQIPSDEMETRVYVKKGFIEAIVYGLTKGNITNIDNFIRVVGGNPTYENSFVVESGDRLLNQWGLGGSSGGYNGTDVIGDRIIEGNAVISTSPNLDYITFFKEIANVIKFRAEPIFEISEQYSSLSALLRDSVNPEFQQRIDNLVRSRNPATRARDFYEALPEVDKKLIRFLSKLYTPEGELIGVNTERTIGGMSISDYTRPVRR